MGNIMLDSVLNSTSTDFVDVSLSRCRFFGHKKICVVNHATQSVSYHNDVIRVQFDVADYDFISKLCFDGDIFPLCEAIEIDGQLFQLFDNSEPLPELLIQFLASLEN
jgi:hypothetical protein